MRIAVVGAGISGNLAARLLSSRHEVHLFDANAYPGGHTNTVDFRLNGTPFALDTGFMVFNDRTYPNFRRMLSLLGVPEQPSDMSFSVKCERSGLEYQGSSLNGLFAQRRNLVRPSFLGLLRDIVRFNRQGCTAMESGGELAADLTMGEFLTDGRYGAAFVDQYLLPMTAAIWSSDPRTMRDFPARFLLGFLHNHGLLHIRNRPQWMTIPGGARRYVRRLLEPLEGRVHLKSPVRAVRRTENEVVLTTEREEATFDRVVFACHADQSLALLTDADESECRILSAFPYHANAAVLHTDSTQLPTRPRAWASWNYCVPNGQEAGASVTYDLTRLQRVDSETPVLLTLNPHRPIPQSKTIRQIGYRHPAFGIDSVRSQQQWSRINGPRGTYFCGAYWRYGFHEDGVRSALAVAEAILQPGHATTPLTCEEPSSLLNLLKTTSASLATRQQSGVVA